MDVVCCCCSNVFLINLPTWLSTPPPWCEPQHTFNLERSPLSLISHDRGLAGVWWYHMIMRKAGRGLAVAQSYSLAPGCPALSHVASLTSLHQCRGWVQNRSDGAKGHTASVKTSYRQPTDFSLLIIIFHYTLILKCPFS